MFQAPVYIFRSFEGFSKSFSLRVSFLRFSKWRRSFYMVGSRLPSEVEAPACWQTLRFASD